MNIAEVKKAREVIDAAEREMEQTVKEYLETVKVIENADVMLEDFVTEFMHDGLRIVVFFRCDISAGDYNYSISCQEYDMYYYQPPRDNARTAQGTVDVVWDEVEKDGKMEPVVKTIRLQSYYK